MKKLIATSILVCMLTNSYGQDSLSYSSKWMQGPDKKCLNEIGVDMTPFLKFYLNFQGNNGSNYQPNYMLTYRRYLQKGNFRSAIGGNYTYNENSSPLASDTLKTKYVTKASNISFRIGYEFFQNLSKRWQLYYGADLISSHSYSRNDAPYFNAGYANGLEGRSQSYGLAPLLGMRFKLNKRLSVITESCFIIRYSENTYQNYYIPISPSYSSKGKEPKTTSKSYSTAFHYPLSLILTLAI